MSLFVPDPPASEPPIATAERSAAAKLPQVVVSPRWLQWFGALIQGINQAPSRRATLSLSGQSASLATTPIPVGELLAGVWRVSYTARITTPATTSSSLEVVTSWTDGGVSQTQTAAAITGNTTTTVQFGTLVIRIDRNTPVSLSTIYASVGAQPMLYSIDVVLEALALDVVS